MFLICGFVFDAVDHLMLLGIDELEYDKEARPQLCYPSTEESLTALIEAAPSARSFPPGGYLKNRDGLNDPWGKPFQYQSPGQHNEHTFDVWSDGADGAPGGTGLDAEIGNWSEDEKQE